MTYQQRLLSSIRTETSGRTAVELNVSPKSLVGRSKETVRLRCGIIHIKQLERDLTGREDSRKVIRLAEGAVVTHLVEVGLCRRQPTNPHVVEARGGVVLDRRSSNQRHAGVVDLGVHLGLSVDVRVECGRARAVLDHGRDLAGVVGSWGALAHLQSESATWINRVQASNQHYVAEW